MLLADSPYAGIGDELDAPRDAAGLVPANGGRGYLVNIGGVHYQYEHFEAKTGLQRREFSVTRAFDICTKQFKKVGDLGVETYAIQSVASERLNLLFTCGGEARDQEKDGRCIRTMNSDCILRLLATNPNLSPRRLPID